MSVVPGQQDNGTSANLHRRIAIDLEEQFAGNYIVKRYQSRGVGKDGPAILGTDMGGNTPGRRKFRLKKNAA